MSLLAERGQQSEAVSVLAPASLLQITPILSVLCNVAMALEESRHGFRNRPLLCCASGRGRHRISAIDVPLRLGVEGFHNCGDSPLGNLTAPPFEGLPDPLALVKAINMEGAIALVEPDISTARPETRAGFEVSPERVELAIS